MADPKNGGPSKFDKAVARATGQEVAGSDSNAPEIGNVSGPGMVSKVTQEQIDAMVNSGKYEFAPQIHKLEEGDMIAGILEGNGPPAEFERLNPVTKELEINTVQTWIIASPSGDLRLSILSSVQLDSKLPPLVGGMVQIIRGKDINTKNGQRVTNYLVAAPKLEGGKRRSWATKPALPAASTETKALPEGSQVIEAPATQPAAATVRA